MRAMMRIRRPRARCARAIAAGDFPLVLSGSCVTAPGVLSSIDHSSLGILWIDAHADFNTPSSSVTGFLPGMSLAIVTGHCYGSWWTALGNGTPVV
jgi:arginase